MSAKPTYSIDFHSLKVGGAGSDYAFPIDDRFFEQWPESEISRGAGTVAVHLLRHASMLELRVVIDAEVHLTCDRCLDEFLCPVHFEGDPVVKISASVPDGELYSGDAHEVTNNSDGDVLWISPVEDALDLGQYLYESIILALPFQRVHPDIQACNQDMLKRFQIVSEEEFEAIAHTPEAEEEDDRHPFAVLAGLKADKPEDQK